MRTINLIYAQSLNGVIGHQGQIPWHLPADLKRFKQLTQGATVIMGRKTWESLPVKPLPGRENIVLSHDMNYQAPGAVVVSDFQAALDKASHDQVWVIGGEAVYKQAIPYADYAYVTIVHLDVPGDTYAPQFTGRVIDASQQNLTHTPETGPSFDYQYVCIEVYRNYVCTAQDRPAAFASPDQSPAG